MIPSTTRLTIAGVALCVGLSGCAWMKETMNTTMSKARELFTPKPAENAASEPARSEPSTAMADASEKARSPLAGGPGTHLETAEQKVVTTGYGDCVNLGHSVAGGAHPEDCGAPGAQVAAAPAQAEPSAAPPRVEEPVAAAPPAPEPAPAPETPPTAAADSGAGSSTPEPGTALSKDTGSEQLTQEPQQAAAPPAQTPPPATAAVEPAPQYEKVSLQGDALFRFGKHDEQSILPEGKRRLDELAGRITEFDKSSIESITIVGHADRLGKQAANQRLSEMRAETVKNYLVAKGVDEQLVQSSGKGSAQPIAQCTGNKKSAKLVKCLEPNRRVEVVIRGQKEKVSRARTQQKHSG